MKKYKIKNDFIYLNFKTWLRKNKHRFNVTPYIKKGSRTSFRVIFQGVKQLEIKFDKDGGVNLLGFDEGVLISWCITDFDPIEARSDLGYYCYFNPDPIYYKTRSKVWEVLCYEGILRWANEKLNSETSLCLYEFKDDEMKWMKIVKNESLQTEAEAKYRIYARTIVQGIQRKSS